MSLPNLNKSMSARLHTKDMAYLNTWMNETTNGLTRNRTVNQSINKLNQSSTKSSTAASPLSSTTKHDIDVYAKSFALLNATHSEIDRQIGAHCLRLSATSSKHWNSMSKLFDKMIRIIQNNYDHISNLENENFQSNNLRINEINKFNTIRSKLMNRVQNAENDVDHLESQLKTALHIKDKAIQERENIENILEKRLGGGSRRSGGGSDESSNKILTALERSQKDVTLLQKLEDGRSCFFFL
jgi:hypothetical protein